MSEIIGQEYLIIKTIGSGFTSNIYLVKSIATEEIYAAKVYNCSRENYLFYLKEVEIMKKLSLNNTPGIIRLITYGEEPIIRDGIPDENIVKYIIMDYMPNKDLFYYIKKQRGLTEREAYTIFRKIVEAINHCHKQGICHRDLKLENILLDENNNPVICDFGFASLIEEKDKKLTDILGTEHYCPPEIKRPYDGFKVDSFSLGVLLFTLIFAGFGFSEAKKSNKLYKLIYMNKFEEYWKEIGKKYGKDKVDNISKEFKRLFFRLVAYDPNKRLSTEEILNDDWMKME